MAYAGHMWNPWARTMAVADGMAPAFTPHDAPARSRTRLSMPNPWQSGSLSPIVWDDIFGLSLPQMSRDQAMTIPGVARGRGIVLSLIADKPLFGYRGSTALETQPPWLYRTPGWAGPWQRMARTLDDHIFYGMSLWGLRRGQASAGLRPILDAWHIHWDDWQIDDAGRICVVNEDGQFIPADADDVVLLPAAHEGFLQYAMRTLAGAVDLERTWISRAKNPVPMVDLHETQESGIDPDEAQALVNDWATARNDPNGAIAYSPFNLEVRALGQYSPDMFIEARNAARLDIAAFFQLPGSLLDATTATASLTYKTQEGDANSLDTLTVPYWARPVEDRLSQDDVVAAGQIVRFAWGSAYTEPPGPIITSAAGHPVIQDAAAAVVADAVTTGVINA